MRQLAAWNRKRNPETLVALFLKTLDCFKETKRQCWWHLADETKKRIQLRFYERLTEIYRRKIEALLTNRVEIPRLIESLRQLHHDLFNNELKNKFITNCAFILTLQHKANN